MGKRKKKTYSVGIHTDAAGNVTIAAPTAVAIVNPDQLKKA